MAKYVFDSNIFINLQRRQPIDIFPSLWNKIGELMSDGTIISSQEVYDEIMIGGDDLEKWAKARKEFFCPLMFRFSKRFVLFSRRIVDLSKAAVRKIPLTPLL